MTTRPRRWAMTTTSILILSAILALVGFDAPDAHAKGSGPGWMLHATSYPTNLVTGVDQVDQVVTEGVPFTLSFEGVETPPIPAEGSAAELQSDLEAMPRIGAGNVGVTEPTSGTYQVIFQNLLGAMKLPRLEAVSGASTVILTKGASSGTVQEAVFNVGAGDSSGTITVTDRLPAGVVAKEAGEVYAISSGLNLISNWGVAPQLGHNLWSCSGNGPNPTRSVTGATVVSCVNNPEGLETFKGGGSGSPQSGFVIPQPPVGITVEAESNLQPAINRVSIAGGGAATAASTTNILTNTEAGRKGIVGWDAWASRADGTLDTQAGSHPYEFTTIFDFATATDMGSPSRIGTLPGGEPRNIDVKLPPGFIGNLKQLPQCTLEELSDTETGVCTPAAMVGKLFAQDLSSLPIPGPVWNMVPASGEPARFGFKFGGVPVLLDFSDRSGGDYGITVHSNNIPQRLVTSVAVTIWGQPGAKSHDPWRGQEGCTQEMIEEAPIVNKRDEESYCTSPQRPNLTPLISLPTSCGAPAPFAVHEVNTWQDPGEEFEQIVLNHDSEGRPVGLSGCQLESFGPSLTALLDGFRADTPAGLTAEVGTDLGGLEDPEGLRSSDLAATTVTLPQGFTINPGQAAGLDACTPSQAGLEPLLGGLENDGPAACPPASKVGTVQIKSPLIEAAEEKQFEGSVYAMASNPPEVKLLIAASADGVNVKLPGVVHLDPQTGQLTATFENTPQLPFSRFSLTFFGGSRAALVTPSTCGSYEAAGNFTPWASPAIPGVSVTSPMGISAGASGGPCPVKPLPFSPKLSAGTTNPTAGSSSDFELEVSKPDDQQNIRTIETTLPPGQLAKLAGVPLCPAADAATGNCPAASQIGSVSAAVGPGANPLQVPQPGKAPTAVYLSGPYKSAPLSLVVKVPAQAGPFDLGNVTTRAALHVNPETTQVTATSDPLPQILDGVPLDYQQIAVSIDRQGFIQNPTNCEKMAVKGTIGGSEGASANVSSPYQIGSCASLAFKPKLKIDLKGSTKRSGNPALRATLTYPKGNYANIKRASVALPHSEFLDQAHIKTICTRVQFAAKACPKASIYGHARAITPLLDKPVEGPVYLRSSSNKLPDLVAELNGQIDVVLDGKIDTGKSGGIRNTFELVPDAPVAKFTLKMKGGERSLLVNSENICKKPQHAVAAFSGQNGKSYEATPLITNSCAKKARKGKRGRAER